jgi:hypothetical protein
MAGGTCRASGDSPLPRVIAPQFLASGCSRARPCASYQRILLMFVFGLRWSCCPRADAQSFTTKAIGQSNPAAGASNTITVTLVADAALAAGSAVTVSGLDGAVASSPVTLLDAGDDGETIFSDGTTQGKGAWDSGTLTLTVNSGAGLNVSTNYTFRFQITNPVSAQTSPATNIAASGTAAIASAAMTKPGTALYGVANGADPLTVVVPSFSLKSIQQSTPVSGATNTLTVSLTANFNLAAGSTVTITGLTESQTANSGNLTVSSTSSQLGTSGVWTQSTGELVLTAASGGTASGTAWEVTFTLANTAAAQSSPAVNVSAAIKDGSGNSVGSIASAAMTKPGTALYGVANGADPLTVVVPSFSLKSIQQSTPVSGATNTLTVSLTANFNLAAGSTVTITGLTESQTANSGNLTVSSTSSQLGTSGVWTQSTGELVLTAASGGTASGTACVLTFDLTNTAAAQSSPEVRIEAYVMASGAALTSISRSRMVRPHLNPFGVFNGSDPLQVVVPEFLTRSIAQSTCLAGATNILTLTLTSNMYLSHHHKAIITISPLTGAKASSSVVLLSVPGGNSAADLFWDASPEREAEAAASAFSRARAPPNPSAESLRSLALSRNSSGRWGCGSCAYETLYLHLAPGRVMMANVAYIFQAVLRNPRSDEWEIPQRHALLAPLTIAASSNGYAQFVRAHVQLPIEARDGVANGSQPLMVVAPYFSLRRIGQSSTGQGALNTLVVTLISPFSIPANSSITISGLRGAQLNEGPTPLRNITSSPSNCSTGTCAGFFRAGPAAEPCSGDGYWSRNASSLVMYLCNATLPYQLTVFSFNVTNPLSGQEASPVTLSVTLEFGEYDARVEGEAIENANDNGAAMLVNEFLVAQLAQSNASAGVDNELHMVLASRVFLAPRASLDLFTKRDQNVVTKDLMVSKAT